MSNRHLFLISKHFHPPKRKSHKHLEVTSHSQLTPAPGSYNPAFCLYGFTFPGYFIQLGTLCQRGLNICDLESLYYSKTVYNPISMYSNRFTLYLFLSGAYHLKRPSKLMGGTFFWFITGILPEAFSCAMANPSSFHIPPTASNVFRPIFPLTMCHLHPHSFLMIAGMTVLAITD